MSLGTVLAEGSFGMDFINIRFITQTIYTRCRRINYKIVPVTNFNKYLHYGAMEMNNMYINRGVNNGSEK